MPQMRNHADALCLQSDWKIPPMLLFYFTVVSSTAQILVSPAHLSPSCCFVSLCRTNRENGQVMRRRYSRQVCGGPHAPVPEVWRGRPRAEATASGTNKVLLPLVFTWLIFLFSLASWYLGSSVVMVNLSLFFS